MRISRRTIFQAATAAAGSILANRGALAQNVNLAGEAQQRPRTAQPHPEGFPANNKQSTVSVIKNGDSRRKNVTESLVAINGRDPAGCSRPSNTSSSSRTPCAGHATATRCAASWTPGSRSIDRGRSIVADVLDRHTTRWIRKSGFPEFLQKYKITAGLEDRPGRPQRKGARTLVPAVPITSTARGVSARLAARLFDPDAYVSGRLFQGPRSAVVTLSMKTSGAGRPTAPTRAGATIGHPWLQRRCHAGQPQASTSSTLPARRQSVLERYGHQRLRGPENASFVQSRLQSLKRLRDRHQVGSEAMGVNHEWLGWLKYCGESGVGQWNLAKIDIRGNKLEEVRKGSPPASRYRPPVEVDGSDGGTAADAGVADAPQSKGRRRLCKLHRLSGRSAVSRRSRARESHRDGRRCTGSGRGTE